MNRLALVQRLATECGVSGTASTTIDQTGEAARLVTWIDQAWSELQTWHDDWDWMRSSNLLGAGASFVTVAGQASYPLGTGAGTCGITAANFGKWDRESFRSYTTTVGTSNEMHLDEIGFDVWRDGYMLGALRTVQTRPYVVAVGTDQSVCLGPPPDATYTITADYFVAPNIMAEDDDLPNLLPTPFHMAIVYRAMQFYAGYESAPEVMQRGMAGFSSLMSRLEALRTPRIAFAGALA